jgi:hypothetical protein
MGKLDSVLPSRREESSTELLQSIAKGMSHRDLDSVSRKFLEGYGELIALGFSPQAVGLAMFGATLNFYDSFDMSDTLPDLLRATADRIEQRSRPS